MVADEKVICYGLSVGRIRNLAIKKPNIMLTTPGNLTDDFSVRLRRSNQGIRALE